MAELGSTARRKPHLCDDACVCPVHGTALFYWPAGDDHACQDSSCEYAHGGALDAILPDPPPRGKPPQWDHGTWWR